MSGSMVDATSRRTTSPKRLRRSSSSTARSRSSASSETVKSPSRVTRKKSWRRISIPGNSSSRWRAITDSSGTNTSSTIGTKRGTTSVGTFTRANVSRPDTGSRRDTPIDSDRFEMYGNGRPGPTARGVSTGKICSENSLSIVASSSLEQSGTSATRTPSSASAGRTASSQTRASRRVSSALRALRRSSVSRAESPSGPRASMPASTWSWRPATRTMKNSSRLLA